MLKERVHNLVRDDIGAKSRFPTKIISALKVLLGSIIIDLLQLPCVYSLGIRRNRYDLLILVTIRRMIGT